MALTLSKTGITNNATIEASHVTQSVDALTGLVAYDITVSGSYYVVGPITASGNIIPGATTTYDLGASGRYFNQTYTNLLNVNSITASAGITAAGPIIATGVGYFSGSAVGLKNIQASGNAGSVQFKSVDGVMVGASDFIYDSSLKTLTVTASYAETASVVLNTNPPLREMIVLGGTHSLASTDKTYITLLTGSSTLYLDVTAGGMTPNFSANDQFVFIRNGTEDIEITCSDGSVSFRSPDGNRKINRQYSAITLIASGSSTMYIVGDLKA